MKKISFFLAVVFIMVTFITSCSDNTPVDISDTSDNSSVESNQSVEGIFTKVPVSDDARYTAVSLGASYTAAPGADGKYPDANNAKLTDGAFASKESASYNDEAYAGYVSSGGHTFVIDLGKVIDKIYQFEIHYLATQSIGISRPGTIKIAASLDGKKWHKLDSPTIPEFEFTKSERAVLKLDEYIIARYIRFFVVGEDYWFFLDELSVIADIEADNANEEFANAVKEAYNKYGTIPRPVGLKEIDFSLENSLISKDAKILVNGNNDDNEDYSTLTDGKFNIGSRIAVPCSKDITFTVDLGKEIDDIASFEATFFANTSSKCNLPVAVKITTVDANDNKTDQGILYASSILSNGEYTFSLPLSKTARARYVEFTLFATEGKYYQAEELAVYAYRDTNRVVTYPPVVIETDNTDWGSEADNNYINLVANTTQQIMTDSDPHLAEGADNTPTTSTLMTDGAFAGNSTDIHNGRFFKFFSGYGRTIFFDMKHISAIDRITASFTHVVSWGVLAPETIEVCVTEDGENWYKVGVMKKDDGENAAVYKYELKLNQKIKARYVSLYFTFETWAGCDEVEIFGTKSISGAKSAKDAGYQKNESFSDGRLQPSEDLLGGAKDTCLLYQDQSSAYTVKDLIPYLAYVDRDGKVKDVMFDSFLFLYVGDFPSGGKPHSGGIQSDWEWALKDVFKENNNIYALEEAAASVKETLNLDKDFKYKVIMPIYYPSTSVTDFGDVDGDGKSENFANIKDRLKAINWYIDSTEALFNKQDFKNIELVGYYWFHETINSSDKESVEILNKTSDAVHAKGKDFCWIPYFLSNGYRNWKDYGFDVAVMQPNYAFKEEAPISNLEYCAKYTEQYGMGIEMELSYKALINDQYFQRYMDYLSYGSKYGYMNDCITMYYQEMFIFRDACNAKNKNRLIYEATYQFIKETLKHTPEAIEDSSFETSANTPITGRISLPEGESVRYEIYSSPEHGSLTLHNDGSFTYYPEKDFKGTVEFSLVFKEYFDWSEPCKAIITIK